MHSHLIFVSLTLILCQYISVIVDYVSYRDSSTGSIFIRTLVSTFYKQAGMKHATELSEQVMFCYFMPYCTIPVHSVRWDIKEVFNFRDYIAYNSKLKHIPWMVNAISSHILTYKYVVVHISKLLGFSSNKSHHTFILTLSEQ